MDDLIKYLELIVEPTFADYQANPTSERHAFLACAAIYHAIDRVTYPKGSGNLRKKWREQSLDFLIVDMVAHHFKHVRSDDEKASPTNPGIPLSSIVFRGPYKGGSLDTRILLFVARDAIRFVRQQAGL